MLVAIDYLFMYVVVQAVQLSLGNSSSTFSRRSFSGGMIFQRNRSRTEAPAFPANGWQRSWNKQVLIIPYSSAYHPRTNGLTERKNQAWMSRPRPFINSTDDDATDWDEHLLAAAFAINTSVHSSTRFSN